MERWRFLVIAVAVVPLAVAAFPSWGVTPQQLIACRRLESTNEGAGVAALTKYYDWRVDQWRKLAGGAALAAAAILASLIATLVAGATVEHTVSPEGETIKRTVEEGSLSAPAVALTLLYAVMALVGWISAWRNQRRFLDDLYRMTA